MYSYGEVADPQTPVGTGILGGLTRVPISDASAPMPDNIYLFGPRPFHWGKSRLSRRPSGLSP
jgi:hypothetical protein